VLKREGESTFTPKTTGVVLAGNIGSKDRLSYAFVGDAVNLASRIAGFIKEFGCEVIISQTTHDLLTRSFAMERIAEVKVKGKKGRCDRLQAS
jgi:adenylate cyclase